MLMTYVTSFGAYNADGLFIVRYELALYITMVRFCNTAGRLSLGTVVKLI
jgi:hypothetical protein